MASYSAVLHYAPTLGPTLLKRILQPFKRCRFEFSGYCCNRCSFPSSPYLLSKQKELSTKHTIKIKMESDTSASTSTKAVKLKPIDATPDSFKEFGQVIEASPDGDVFGPQDAQLDLTQGIPRFYIMHIKDRPLKFSTITHHASVTQCLGSIGARVWYLGVSKPSILDSDNGDDKSDKIIVRTSKSGHLYEPPKVDDVRVFRIAGPKFLKLNRGTWHAGPLFKDPQMDFYNLELSNTNVVDHTTHSFIKDNGVVFVIDD
ncbi:hypothetical protein ACFE04_017837 [Oxalis oulophora]